MEQYTKEQLKESKNLFNLLLYSESIYGYILDCCNDYIDVDDFTSWLYDNKYIDKDDIFGYKRWYKSLPYLDVIVYDEYPLVETANRDIQETYTLYIVTLYILSEEKLFNLVYDSFYKDSAKEFLDNDYEKYKPNLTISIRGKELDKWDFASSVNLADINKGAYEYD